MNLEELAKPVSKHRTRIKLYTDKRLSRVIKSIGRYVKDLNYLLREGCTLDELLNITIIGQPDLGV